jgi:hypothetical protein
MPTYTITEPNGDVLLAQTLPEAEYMFGCTPTAVAMVLGYYDLYGYRGTGLPDMIEGEVDSKSRGTDGNAYNMNAFDTALGRATATESFVSRFHSSGGKETTPSHELKYAFKSDRKTMNTDVWDCIADYLGTGQYWRGNDNLSTSITYCSLEELYDDDSTFEITAGSTTRTVRHIDTSMLYGLDLYVQSRGYAMDYEITGSYLVDVAGGSFTFADYMREIDAGRPVLISIQGHSMTGYGYNADTEEIIFDDCYVSGRRMTWGGTYRFDKADRKLQAVTVIGINVNGSVDPAIKTIPDSDWKKLAVTSAPGATENEDYCFAGDALYLNFTVSNLGADAAGAFGASVRVDGELVRTETVDNLGAGEDRNMQDIPLGELTVGLHNVRVVLDEPNDLQELTGSNNTAETDILVLKAGASVVDTFRTVGLDESVADVYVPGGAILMLEGGSATGTVLRGTVTENNASQTAWIPAQIIVSQGGYASGTDIYSFGEFIVSSGGTAADARVFSRGSASVQNGGTLLNASVASGGKLTVSSGGKLTGLIRFEDGASVWGGNGGILDFDLSSIAPDAAARVNDLTPLRSSPLYTITVSGTQAHGTYRLAEGAAKFKQTVTVMGTDGVRLGTLADGETETFNGSDYTLNLDLDGGVLMLTVSEHVHVDSVAPTVSNIRADLTDPTWMSVTVSADFVDDESPASGLYRIGANGAWTEYQDGGVTVRENTAVFFKAVDAAGNESEIARYDVSNITSSGCVISAGQNATVLPGRTFTDAVISGGMTVSADGAADGVAVGETGSLTVLAGGKVTGPMRFAPGADVSFEKGAVLDFDISTLAPGADALLNALSSIHGTPDYTLTVSGAQKKGLYVLASGADGFGAAVSVLNATGSPSGSLEIGQTVDIGGMGCSLNCSDGMLTLTVGKTGIANAADSGWNNWLYDKKTKTPNGRIRESAAVELNAGATDILLDSPDSVSHDGMRNFVGYCDAADFAKITLDCAAKLSFLADASNAAKFIVYRLIEGTDGKGNPTYKLKAVQTTSLTKKKNYAAATGSLLLKKGDYYIAMKSANTKTGGSVYYNVSLNHDEKKTVFFTDGDGGDNNWLYDKKTKEANSLVRNAAGISLKTGNIQIDDETPSGEGSEGWNNFVGFGDDADFAKLDLNSTAKASFTIEATNAAKFVIYRLVEGKDRTGKPTYKLKTVKTATLKKKTVGDSVIYTATTKITLPAIENGEYFIAVKSTNAQKGKSAYYNVTVDTLENGDSAPLLQLSGAQNACAPDMPETPAAPLDMTAETYSSALDANASAVCASGLAGPESVFPTAAYGLLA